MCAAHCRARNKTSTRRLTNLRRRSNNPVTEFPGPSLTQDTIVARKELATSLSGAGMKRARLQPSRVASAPSLLACFDPAHGCAPAHAAAGNPPRRFFYSGVCSRASKSQVLKSQALKPQALKFQVLKALAREAKILVRSGDRVARIVLNIGSIPHSNIFYSTRMFHPLPQCAAAGRAEISP